MADEGPTVFLDFDGVLSNAASRRAARLAGWSPHPSATTRVAGSEAAPDPACVSRLDRLVTATGARIVVTSSWRTDRDVEALRACLRDEFGLARWEAVVGRTGLPDMDTRAHQVSDHVAWNGIRDYVVLDDVELPFKRQRRRWVMVDPETGLSDDDVGRCLSILGFGPDAPPRP